MNQKNRVSKLEQEAKGQAEDPPPDGIILTWPGDETAATRRHNRKAWRWLAQHGWPEGPIDLTWPDGSQVLDP